MGNEQAKPGVHEQIVNLINASSSKTNEHADRSASALEVLACIAIAAVIVAVLYFAYKLLSSYERMRAQTRIDRAMSLNNVRAI